MALKVKPNLNPESLLIPAAKYGNSDSVTFMLRNGTAPDSQDEIGFAALRVVAFTPESDTQAVELLLDAKSNVNIHGGPFDSALQAAAFGQGCSDAAQA